MEERDVAIVYFPGAYLHAKWPTGKRVILRLAGQFVNIMCQVNPKYLPYVRIELRNGKKVKVLYLKVLRALYGALESALLWYELYSGVLKNMGFALNPYDKCVANKTIDGGQCTIVFYVDDNKIGHEDPAVVNDIINELNKYFGKLTLTRSNKFSLLGMDIEIKNKRVYLSMKGQLLESIDMYGSMEDNEPVWSVSKSLYEISDTNEPLSTKDVERFHSMVAKLLFICKRV